MTRITLIQKRMEKLVFTTKIHVGQVKLGVLNKLQQILKDAELLARNPKLNSRQQAAWSQVAALAAKIIHDLAGGFRETEVENSLAELQRMVRSAANLE